MYAGTCFWSYKPCVSLEAESGQIATEVESLQTHEPEPKFKPVTPLTGAGVTLLHLQSYRAIEAMYGYRSA